MKGWVEGLLDHNSRGSELFIGKVVFIKFMCIWKWFFKVVEGSYGWGFGASLVL